MLTRIAIDSQAAIWFLLSIMLLVFPEPLLALGTSHTPFTVTVARIFGAELMGLTLASWFTRHTADPVVRRHLLFSYFVSNTLGFIVCLWGRLSGTLIPLGWVVVALYLIYAVVFAYLRFAPGAAAVPGERRAGGPSLTH